MSPSTGSKLNCPSCGASTPPLLRHAKIAVCAYCNSALFIEDAQVASAGEKSVLTEIPSILAIGRRFSVGNWNFEPVGRIRYEYGGGEGFWDEWWISLSGGKTNWISNDEGEYVIQNEASFAGDPPEYESFRLGEQIELLGETVRVTELNSATCIGIEGQLPEIVRRGDVHRYAHLEGRRGVLITAEYEHDSVTFYTGSWLDPFDIRIS